MYIDAEYQGNRHDKGTIGLENGRDLITASHQSLADQINRIEAGDSDGVLNAPPPSEHLKYHPGKPEFMHGG